MEYNIKDVGDITYLAGLSRFFSKDNKLKKNGINSPKQLTFTLFRKLWAH